MRIRSTVDNVSSELRPVRGVLFVAIALLRRRPPNHANVVAARSEHPVATFRGARVKNEERGKAVAADAATFDERGSCPIEAANG
jgi:hypothetical protein